MDVPIYTSELYTITKIKTSSLSDHLQLKGHDHINSLTLCAIHRRLILVKFIFSGPVGSERSSVIESGEVVRSLEAHNALKQC